jgi:hypothetical protein
MHPHLPRDIRICGHEPGSARVMLIEVSMMVLDSPNAKDDDEAHGAINVRNACCRWRSRAAFAAAGPEHHVASPPKLQTPTSPGG